MYKKVLKYLTNKKKLGFTEFDEILKYYINGDFLELLEKLGAECVEFFPDIGKESSSLQVYFNFYNIGIIFEFNENYFEWCRYERNTPKEKIEKGTYENFNIEEFIKKTMNSLEKEVDKSQRDQYKLTNKNKKIYKIISLICILMFVMIVVPITAYVLILNATININSWLIGTLVFLCVGWLVFSILSIK